MQNEKKIRLVVLSPQKTLLDAMVDKVTLPASRGRFMVLYNHAPVITSLEEGNLVYENDSVSGSIYIDAGFAEVCDNIVTICAEV